MSENVPVSLGGNYFLYPLNEETNKLAYQHNFINLRSVEPSFGIPTTSTHANAETSYYFPLIANATTYVESRKISNKDNALVYRNDNIGVGNDTPNQRLTISGSISATEKVTIGDNHTNDTVYSSVLGGVNNTVSSDYSSIVGGTSNTVLSAYSYIGGGLLNEVNSWGGLIIGGTQNVINGNSSNINGGSHNRIDSVASNINGGDYNIINTFSDCSNINGGFANILTGLYSTINGGYQNIIASGDYSSVLGGGCNISYASFSSVAGGICNTASGYYGNFVMGGGCNTANCSSTSILGGCCNTTSGYYSSIINGQGNTVNNDHSVIVGGLNNELNGCNSFILGSNIIGNANDTTYVQNLSVTQDLAVYGNIYSNQKTVTSIGDNTNLSFQFFHNFNTKDLITQVHDNNTSEVFSPTITYTSTNSVTITFSSIPTENQYRVVVINSPISYAEIPASPSGGGGVLVAQLIP